MTIQLSGQVVIFDEAHNMEDSARDAASSSMIQDDIQAAMQDCEKVGRLGTEPYAHAELVGSFNHFLFPFYGFPLDLPIPKINCTQCLKNERDEGDFFCSKLGKE